MNRTSVTITNRNNAAVRSIGRRFRPGIPRTLNLLDNQLNVVRGNPWLWIEGEDWDGGEEPVDLTAFYDVELRELAHFLELPGARKASRTELIEAIEEAREEVAAELGDDPVWADKNVEELKEALRDRDLPVSGAKDELIARLEEADADRVLFFDFGTEEPDEPSEEE